MWEAPGLNPRLHWKTTAAAAALNRIIALKMNRDLCHASASGVTQ